RRRRVRPRRPVYRRQRADCHGQPQLRQSAAEQKAATEGRRQQHRDGGSRRQGSGGSAERDQRPRCWRACGRQRAWQRVAGRPRQIRRGRLLCVPRPAERAGGQLGDRRLRGASQGQPRTRPPGEKGLGQGASAGAEEGQRRGGGQGRQLGCRRTKEARAQGPEPPDHQRH
ncbi:hypothetical protein IWQ57_006838, partial [Coemansia nantahalensis]